MRCPACRHENPAHARFCLECGTRLTRSCPRCRAELPPSAKFCLECGERVGQAAPSAPLFAAPDAYTPGHLAERILTSRSALEGERKQVTVLFADLKGSMELLADRDPEEARQILDPVLERMMAAVHRYEGTVNQVMGDGIMALFGAPIAHEDHAVRACYAALSMQEAVKRYAEQVRRSHGIEVQIRVGLNSGEVVVRSIGSDLRMDYTAVGQTTHLAARMEQLATPGTIRLTAATLRLAEGFVEVRPLGQVPVRGLAEPVEVYEVVAAGPARTRLEASARRGLTRFVGRDAELEQLHRLQERVAGGRGQVAALVGEAGVGKSRLVHEIARSHRTRGWLALAGACVSYGRARSFLPVVDLLKAYFRLQDGDDHREIREKATGKLLALDRALEPALPAVLSLLDVRVDDPAWSALDPAERRRRTLDAVKALVLREASEQPVLLIIEDLHWVDGETQALLDALVEGLGTARILLLVNHRPEYEHRWDTKAYCHRLRLDALPAESAAELLDALLGEDGSLAPLKQLLVRRGNPFFLEETVRTLAETGALAGERGRYRLARPLQAVQVPATVQAILAARIDRLAPEDKGLLQVASVVGKDVPIALLRAAADLPEEALHRGLERLQRAELVYEAALFPDPQYSFTHALTLEVTYGGLLRERRCALHDRVLEALEQAAGGRAHEQIEQLAHHAVRAERWDRAARYLHQAGERAYAHARYRAAAAFYEEAVAALTRLGGAADHGLEVDAYLGLWSARTSFGRHDGSRELGEKAEALARALGDGPRLAQVQLRRAQAVAFTCAMPGTLESAIEQAREAFERAGPDDLRTRSYARFIVGHALLDLGRIAEAVEELDAGIDLFAHADRRGGEAGLAFPIYVSLGAWRAEAHAALGEFDRALASANDALRMAAEIRHASSLAVADMFLGAVHAARGDLGAAVPPLERGLVIAAEHDLHMGTVRAAANLARALAVLGERDRALECLARARARSAEAGVAHHGPATGYGAVTAAAYLAAGRPADAAGEIEQGLAAAAAPGARGRRAPLLRLQAELLADRDAAAARERLGEALALADELGLRPEAAHCQLGLAALCRRTGDAAGAEQHLGAAVAMYRGMRMTHWAEQAERRTREP